MNRIILIGNGFDLAHGMETKYEHFIKRYWKSIVEKMEILTNKCKFENDEFSIDVGYWYISDVAFKIQERNLQGIKKAIEEILLLNKNNSSFKLKFQIKNKFLKDISEKLSSQTWVDIENEYYTLLKKSLEDKDNSRAYNIDDLNKDLDGVRCLLEKYLTEQEEKTKINKDLNKEIGSEIYSPISVRDVPDSKIGDLSKSISNKVKLTRQKIDKNPYVDLTEDREYYKYASLKSNYYIQDYIQKLARISGGTAVEIANSIKGVDKSADEILELLKEQKIDDYLLLPDNFCFLNFNYTHTPKNYITDDDNIEYISIHGELNNEKNRMIFGYGDELDEKYKEIENLNDNKYMENIKSTKYHETDNYRRLLTFINSGTYQVYVMGHSCGNSDRTLLNTLFEHDNCISIKPYYHLKEDGTDNYSDIVRNISRNFTDKQKLRERVVNKTYCEPLLKVER